MNTFLFRRNVRRIVATLLAVLCVAPASAQLRTMSEAELSKVSGQGLFEVSNSSANGFDFTRFSINADVALNANLKNIRLGEYQYLPNNGLGADLDIRTLQFGRSDVVGKNLVQISNPYFEFVYQGSGTAREVVGMRLGFDSIAGDVGLKIASLSGSLKVDAGAAGVLDSSADPANSGKRWDGTCATCAAGTPTLAQLGGVHAGDANGPSRDFWISVLKTPVQFPNGPSAAVQAAQAGVWLNWRDRLTSINLTGAVPANLPPAR